MKTPPPSLIDYKGRLVPELVKLLHEQFGFSVISLEKTIYKEIRFHMSAITWFNHVYYDKKCLNKTELEWLLLIIHEQVHRDEVGNHPLKASAWYLGYVAGYVKAGFSYRKNEYEVRAYEVERKAKEILSRLDIPFLK